MISSWSLSYVTGFVYRAPSRHRWSRRSRPEPPRVASYRHLPSCASLNATILMASSALGTCGGRRLERGCQRCAEGGADDNGASTLGFGPEPGSERSRQRGAVVRVIYHRDILSGASDASGLDLFSKRRGRSIGIERAVSPG